MSLAEHMESVDKITAEDLADLEYTEYPVEAMDKTKAPIEAEKMVVILVPVASGLKAMKEFVPLQKNYNWHLITTKKNL